VAELASLHDAVADLVHDEDVVAMEGFTHLIPASRRRVPHDRRDQLDCRRDDVGAVGYGTGGDYRRRIGLAGGGANAVITDLAIVEPDPETKELTLVAVHPGVELDDVLAKTGWPLLVSADLTTTPAPTEEELAALRKLKRRTEEAHRGGS
jgi:acyl CoA:acetate/3-ketoacid CoA transferase beta subunit